MKKIFFFIFMMLLFFSTGYAKEYNIDSAYFNVLLNKNGDAKITETWNVSFIEGNFTRFHKEIYTKLTELERFDSIEFIEAKINNEPANQVYNDTNRIDNTYYIDNQFDRKRIDWYKSTSNETVQYQITYVLNNVVKATDNNLAIFTYRFTGLHFENNIDNTVVNIVLPEEGNINLRFPQNVDNKIESNNISLFKNNHTGLLKYSISMPLSMFDNLKYISLQDVEKEEIKSLENDNSFIIFIILIPFLIVLAFIIFPLAIITHNKNKIKKLINEDPKYFKKFTDHYNDMSIVNIISDLGITKNEGKVFTLLLFDLCNNNKATIKKETIEFSKEVLNENNEYSNFLNILLKYLKYSENDLMYVFSIDEANNYLKSVKSNKMKKEIRKIISSTSSSDKKMIIDSATKVKISYWLKYNPEYTNTDLYSFYEIVRRNGSISFEKMMAIAMFPDKAKLNKNNVDTDDHLFLFCNTVLQMSHVSNGGNSYDSSGCSSCSSCSSCGGCGGAD